MAKSLLIVESPTKVKTISRYLGENFIVRATMGHVRDLPEKTFGVDIVRDFKPEYRILTGRGKVIKALKKDMEGVDIVYLATDPDREGEAIAWHVAEALKLSEKRTHRITFNEITRQAITESLKHPGLIDSNLVNAQQARRILDRIVGYELSPLLSRKVVRGLSAGRVQSVAVRLIAEREREIQAFKPEEYWEIECRVKPSGAENEAFIASIWGKNGQEISIQSEEHANQIVTELNSSSLKVSSFQEKESRIAPYPPFNTSSMQQGASTQLRFSASKTMRIAQQLYEGVELGPEGPTGLITYMRTDSFRIADQALGAVRDYINQQYGGQYLPEKAREYKSPKAAQAAHEAIRPADVNLSPDGIKSFLSPDQLKLYRLIWTRFVASQMESARYWVRSAEIEAGACNLRARGRRLIFDGHIRLTGRDEDKEKDEQELPKLDVGAQLDLLDVEPSRHFTQPPSRYTEASLVKSLEREGIGRPSTYATIISTIQQRNYVRQVKRKFHATDLGLAVTDQLVKHFPREIEVGFTATMEERLDDIETGKAQWLDVLREFYSPFKTDLEAAKTEMQRPPLPPDAGDKAVCAKCGSAMAVRFDPQGNMFLGCSNYPTCSNIVDLKVQEEERVESEHKCPKCGAPLLIKSNRRGRKYFACSAYPACSNIMGIDTDGKPVEMRRPEETGINCEKCGRPMLMRKGKRGDFLGCSGYPKCRNTKPKPDPNAPEQAEEKPNPNAAAESADGDAERQRSYGKCPECGAALSLRWGPRGRFLGCVKYPECKYSKSAKGVASAPQPEMTDQKCDKCGKPMVIRSGRHGRFLACTGFPGCRNAKPVEKTGLKCPQEGCSGEIVPRRGRGGKTFYGCSNYPECKYTSNSLPGDNGAAEEKPEHGADEAGQQEQEGQES
ncbi:MAG TPA: type I DNA topoisomerase [Candidatus Brocadiia bacterium]|nr:type I DNA topoisomerase [Candidatus Brocadiia bacterium]